MNFDTFEIRQERFIALEEIFPTFGEVENLDSIQSDGSHGTN
jgi:hypothetical protein